MKFSLRTNMLKKIFFEGMIIADTEKSNRFDHEYYVKEAIRDDEVELVITSIEIKKLSDIPQDWTDGYPFGDRKKRGLPERKCFDIFQLEILPNLPVDDPNQVKFTFWNDRSKLQKQNQSKENADGKAM